MKAHRGKFLLDVVIASPVILVITIFQILPTNLSRCLGRLLGRFLHLIRVRRRTLRKNLAIAFPDMPEEQIKQTICKIALNFGDFLGEWLAMPRDKSILEKRVHCIGFEIIEEGLKQGKGVMFCSAHFGNWEILASTIAQKSSRPLTIVRQRLKNLWIDRWFTQIHKRMGYGDIIRGKSALDIYRRLKHNEVVGMLVDQSGRSAGVWVPFFGRPTSFHRGPGVLAFRTGCSIAAAFCRADPNGWVIEFSKLEIDPTGDIEIDTERLMSLYAEKLEAAIRLNPDWYFWYHRRWKTKVPPAVQEKWEQK